MVNDLKELEKFLKICRKQGVVDISIGNLSVKLGDIPISKEASELSEIETPDDLTPEQLMFYAVNNGVSQQ